MSKPQQTPQRWVKDQMGDLQRINNNNNVRKGGFAKPFGLVRFSSGYYIQLSQVLCHEALCSRS
jgi:hypothetical protein